MGSDNILGGEVNLDSWWKYLEKAEGKSSHGLCYLVPWAGIVSCGCLGFLGSAAEAFLFTVSIQTCWNDFVCYVMLWDWASAGFAAHASSFKQAFALKRSHDTELLNMMSVEKKLFATPRSPPCFSLSVLGSLLSSSSGGWGKNTQCMCRNALKFCSGPNTLLPCLNYDTFLFSGLWFFLSEPGYALWFQWKLKADFWHV